MILLKKIINKEEIVINIYLKVNFKAKLDFTAYKYV